MRPALTAESQSETLLDALRSHVEQQGDKTACTFVASDDLHLSTTYEALDSRARHIAYHLLSVAKTGDRALMMYPTGLEFIEAFLGCLYAGIIAVPAYPPKKNRNAERILAIAEDCQPSLFLCTSATKKDVEDNLSTSAVSAPAVATDEIVSGKDFPIVLHPRAEALALLQYTSGSTSTPKGVKVTHANLIDNAQLIQKYSGWSKQSVNVSWLPIFHDMGLIGNILTPIFIGYRTVIMSPASFLRQPARWLQAVTQYNGTIIGAPNFAYDLCARKVTDEEKSEIDLASLVTAYNAAEPVRAKTLQEFYEAFARCGFRRNAFFTYYGLAETTLCVSGGPPLTPINVVTADPSSLEEHRIVDSHTGNAIVACGQIGPDLEVRIVNHDTAVEVPENEVGEIWATGRSVAAGYWNRPEETEVTFQAKLKGDDRAWLRTGDYGFVRDGQLYVTGRLKDLIILRGRNIYPHDIEQLVEQHLTFIEPNSCAAFSVDDDDQERLVILAEGTRAIARWPNMTEDSRASETQKLHQHIDDLATAIAERFEISLSAICFLRPTTFPRTSSGKVQRRQAKRIYLEDHASIVHRWGKRPPATIVSPLYRKIAPTDTNSISPPANAQTDRRKDLIRAVVLDWLRSDIDPSIADVDGDQSLTALGMDSLAAISLTTSLEKALNRSLADDLLFEKKSINDLVGYIETEHEDTVPISIRLAQSEQDLEAIYQFRYDIYVREMNRQQHYANHERQRIVDPLDDHGDVFGAWEGDDLVGTVRVNRLSRDPLDNYRDIYRLNRLSEYDLKRSSISTRFMLSPHVRRSKVASQLLESAFEHCLRHGVEVDYCDCNDPLLGFFKQVGYSPERRITHPEYGDVTVLRLDTNNLNHLESVGSPLAAVLRRVRSQKSSVA